MSYTYLGNAPNGNSRYRVKISVYRDCFQSDVPFDEEIPLGIYTNNEQKSLYKVEKLPLGNVSKVRPPGSDDCDYYVKNVCIEFGYYEGVVELAPSNAGYHLTFVRCCRNHQDNIPDQDGAPFQGQTYYGFIPATSLKNSSPAFSSIPSSFICSNDTAKIVFNAVDPDGDELTYRFVHPFQGGEPTTNGSIPDPPDTLGLPIQAVYYNTGYNAAYPFGITNGSYTSIDPRTGLAKIIATENGSYVLGVEVEEKRNGQVLSVVRMDLQVLVLDCPTNNVPTITSTVDKEVRVEAGAKVCFTVTGSDADEDEIVLNADGIMLTGRNGFSGTRATFPERRQKSQVSSQFCWDTDCEQAQETPYVVTFKVEDDGCPPKANYIDVRIYVDTFIGAKTLVGPPNVCRYNAHWYELSDGKADSKYHWQIVNGTITSLDSARQVRIDWEGSGTGEIRVREESINGCLGDWITMNVAIKESPTLATITGKDTVCLEEIDLAYSVPLNDGNTYKWFAENANFKSITENTSIIGTYNTPQFILKLVEYNDLGCGGDTAYKYVYVSEPNPEIVGPNTVCPNAINIKYTTEENGGSNYSWSVIGGSQSAGGNTATILVDWGLEGLGEVFVVETNRHGCVSPKNKLNVEKTYNLTSNPILGKREVCEYETELYETLDVNGSTYLWTVNGGVQSTGDSTYKISINWGKTGLGSVTVQEKAFDSKNGKACLSDKIELPITIYPTPTTNQIVGIDELCQQETEELYHVNGLNGSTYEWKLDNQLIDSENDTVYLRWNVPGKYVLTVTEISEQGCKGQTIAKTVLVNRKPVTSPINGAAIVCPEVALNQTYIVSGFANSTFYWQVGGADNITDDSTASVVVDWDLNSDAGSLEVVEISDKGCIGDTQKLDIVYDLLTLDLQAVSVGMPDNFVIISWDLDLDYKDRTITVQKRKANTVDAWQSVLNTTLNQTPVSEIGVNTDSFAYEYRLVSLNNCGNTVVSDTHTLVLLAGEKNDLEVDLQFSPYGGWVEGVQAYSLYRSLNNSPYEVVTSNAMPNEIIHRSSDISIFKRCFYIVAEEKDGEQTFSQSNEICFFFEPELYVPNAFTPNNDGLNEGFLTKGIAIQDFELQVFSRWGELLFETKDINEPWQPNYRDVDVQAGVYPYLIKYTDYNNKVYSKSGTIHLIR